MKVAAFLLSSLHREMQRIRLDHFLHKEKLESGTQESMKVRE